MLLAGFEPAIPAIERPQTHALERAANGSSKVLDFDYKYHLFQKKKPSSLRSTIRHLTIFRKKNFNVWKAYN